jgi:hypothetical protein
MSLSPLSLPNWAGKDVHEHLQNWQAVRLPVGKKGDGLREWH